MKKILIFLLMLTVSIAQAQHCSDNINTVTTDWRSPLSLNTWDWTAQYFDVYVKRRVPSYTQIQSPFRLPQGLASTNVNLDHFYTAFDAKGLEGIDFHPEAGWELLYKNLGLPPCRGCTDDVNAANNPFFALYNRYTGVIRVFFLMVNPPNPAANGASISLEFQGNKSAMLSHAFAIMPAVGNFDPLANLQVPNYYANGYDYWLYADFPITFDPCTCNYLSKLKFSVNLITNTTIKLEGELNGTINEIISPQNNASVDDSEFGFYAAAIGSLVEKGKTGYQAYKDISKATSDVWGWMESNSQQTQHLSTQKQAYVQKGRRGSIEDILSGLAPVVSTVASLAGPIGEVAGLVAGAFAFFNDGGETTAVRPPMSFSIQQKITLGGTSSTIIPYQDNVFNNAGAKFSNVGVSTYNNILGVVGVLETPELKQEAYRARYLNVAGNTPGSANNIPMNSYWPADIIKYTLKKPIKYAINPAANVDVISVQGAWVIEVPQEAINTVFNRMDALTAPITSPIGAFFAPGFPYSLPVQFGAYGYNQYGAEKFYQRMEKMGFEVDAFPTDPNGNVIFRTKFFPVEALAQVPFLLQSGLASYGVSNISFRMITVVRQKNNVNAKPIVLVNSYKCTPSTTDTYTASLPIVGNYSWGESYRSVRGRDGRGNLIWVTMTDQYPVQLYEANGTPTVLPFSDIAHNGIFIAGNGSAPGINFTSNYLQKAWKTIDIYDQSVITGTATIESPITANAGVDVVFQAGQEIIVNEGVTLNPGVTLQIGLPIDNLPAISPSKDFAFCTQTAYRNIATSKTVAPTQAETPKDIPVASPKATQLLSVYPNPTTGEATITYEVDKEGSSVSIYLSNNLGIRVMEVSNEVSQAQGTHNVRIDTRSLAAGVYFYTLVLNGVAYTERLVVIK